jgi:hypothetical protein
MRCLNVAVTQALDLWPDSRSISWDFIRGCALIITAAWINFQVAQCQPAHATDPNAGDGIHEPEITTEDRQHWSFRPVVKPSVPVVQRVNSVRNPIDAFILRDLESEELSFAPTADRAALLRRLKLDLLGLPPTPEELEEFLSDRRADEIAYTDWLDRWLASPRYGERQAQRWLDLARFAETDGFEHDKVREDAWQYRDWVIDAINEDMPYHRFVELQLVGDLHGRPQDQIATMFCLASSDMPDINEQDVRRHDRLNELTSTVGASLLGLQMHCAQCHDHKYDPISQADFYRLRAVFECAVPQLRRDKPFNHFAGDAATVVAKLYLRGELSSPGPAVSPAVPRIAVPAGVELKFDSEKPRSSFTRWLFDEENPLTGRVIANRVWQSHFGRGLFANPSDVGVVAGSPTHPELLDWLVCFLREHDWSLKALHREILLSTTYRQASHRAGPSFGSQTEWEERIRLDRDNDLYSRFPRQRLEGEVIRDCLLSVAGLLNDIAGGPGVMPPLPQEMTATLLKGQWKASEHEEDHHRRSVYVFARRNLRYPIFDVFDRPDAGASCPQRNRSTTALQSLQMLNSDLSKQCAEGLCRRVSDSLNDTPSADLANLWVHQLFRIALARDASEAEVNLLQPFAGDVESQVAACLALLNSNEFLYVD